MLILINLEKKKMKKLDYPMCSYVTEKRANEIIDFLYSIGYEDKITGISGVTVDTYIITLLSWWFYYDEKFNLPIEEWGGKQYEEYTSKQEQWVVEYVDGNITHITVLQAGAREI